MKSFKLSTPVYFYERPSYYLQAVLKPCSFYKAPDSPLRFVQDNTSCFNIGVDHYSKIPTDTSIVTYSYTRVLPRGPYYYTKMVEPKDRPDNVHVSSVILPGEALSLTYIKKGGKYEYVDPEQLPGPKISECCTLPGDVKGVGIAYGTDFFFNPEVLAQIARNGLEVYVKPRGIPVNIHTTYTNIFTVAGRGRDDGKSVAVMATVSHIVNTGKAMYVYIEYINDYGNNDIRSVYQASFIDVAQAFSIFRRCSKGAKCFNGIAIAPACSVSQCVELSV